MNQSAANDGQLWQEDHRDSPGADSGQGSSTPDEEVERGSEKGTGDAEAEPLTPPAACRPKRGKKKWTRLAVHIVIRGREERHRGCGDRGGAARGGGAEASRSGEEEDVASTPRVPPSRRGRGRRRKPAPSGEGTHASNMMANVARQLEYYFSRGNLIKDVFLRRHMDVDGWVHVSIIAGFPRMGSLIRRAPTDPVTQQVIMQAAQLTDQVTVSDDLQWLRPVDLADQWPLSPLLPLPGAMRSAEDQQQGGQLSAEARAFEPGQLWSPKTS